MVPLTLQQPLPSYDPTHPSATPPLLWSHSPFSNPSPLMVPLTLQQPLPSYGPTHPSATPPLLWSHPPFSNPSPLMVPLTLQQPLPSYGPTHPSATPPLLWSHPPFSNPSPLPSLPLAPAVNVNITPRGNVTLVEGGAISISCHGNPIDSSAFLFLYHKMLPIEVQMLSSFTVTLPNVSGDDEGSYLCVYATGSTKISSPILNLIVMGMYAYIYVYV